MWTEESFFNPFGPNFLHLKLEEDIRLGLLDLVREHRKTKWEPLKIGKFKNSDQYKNQGNFSEKEWLTVRPTKGLGIGPGGGIIGGIQKEWQAERGNLFKETIESFLQRYGEIYYQGPCSSIVTDCWYSILKKGNFQVLHAHLNPEITELSGSIYLDVPENLEESEGNINWVIGGSHQLLYKNQFGVSPSNGDVFLWPAWLMHMVYPFKEDVERIMIAFNGRTSRMEKEENENQVNYGRWYHDDIDI